MFLEGVANNRLVPNGVKQLRNQIKLGAIVAPVFEAAFDNTLRLFITDNGSFSLQVLRCFLLSLSLLRFYSLIVSDSRRVLNNGIPTIFLRLLLCINKN